MNLSLNEQLYEPNVWNIIRTYYQPTHPFIQKVNEVFSREIDTDISFSVDSSNERNVSIVVNAVDLHYIIDTIRTAFIEYSFYLENRTILEHRTTF